MINKASVAVSADTTLAPLPDGGSMVVDGTAEVTVYDTVNWIDTLFITGGTATVSGHVICEVLRISGGALDGTATDTLHVMGDADFSGLTGETVGVGTVLQEATNEDVDFLHGGRHFNTVALFCDASESQTRITIAGPDTMFVHGDLAFLNNETRIGIWNFASGPSHVVVDGDAYTVVIADAGASPRVPMGSTTWLCRGDVVFRTAYIRNDAATVVLRGDTKQTYSIGGRWDGETPSVVVASSDTVLVTSPWVRDLTLSSGVFAIERTSLRVVGDLEVNGGSATALASMAGCTLSVSGSTMLNGVSAADRLVVGADTEWFLDAQGLLQARYVELSNCNALGTQGVAYDAVDNGGNVNWLFPTDSSPVITGDLVNMAVVEGDTVRLAIVTGGIGDMSYQWYVNGTAVPENDSSVYVHGPATMTDSGLTAYVIASGAQEGADTSAVCTLTVINPPRVTTVYPSGTVNRWVGSTVELSVTALGAGTVAYAWYRNDTLLAQADATLTLESVAKTDNGARYYCVVTSDEPAYADFADTSDEATLRIRYPLTINEQPQDTAMTIGDTLKLWVSVVCDTSVTYQWYFDGAIIDGAVDSILLIDSVATAHEGEYRVKVFWEDRSMNSRTATATIGMTSVRVAERSLPTELCARAMCPGAHRGAALIRFGLPERSSVSITIYDLRGALVRNVLRHSDAFGPGYHQVVWDGYSQSGMPAGRGRYVCVLQADSARIELPLTFVRQPWKCSARGPVSECGGRWSPGRPLLAQRFWRGRAATERTSREET